MSTRATSFGTWKDRPIGDGSHLENGRAQAPGVRLTPLPLTCLWRKPSPVPQRTRGYYIAMEPYQRS